MLGLELPSETLFMTIASDRLVSTGHQQSLIQIQPSPAALLFAVGLVSRTTEKGFACLFVHAILMFDKLTLDHLLSS